MEYSVVIPTYRGAKKLPTVLDSLNRQSIPKQFFEIIVVDDGSPFDEGAAIDRVCKEYSELHIKVFHLPFNLGPAVARNEGIKQASGKIIFFTDDDCEVPALWMQEHIDLYNKYPTVSAIGGWYRIPLRILSQSLFEIAVTFRYESSFDLYRSQMSKDILPFRYNFPAVNTANLSVKAYVLTTVLFDERFKAAGIEDSEFCLRIIRSGYETYYIPRFVQHYKYLKLRSFIRLAKSRGLGSYVQNNINLSWRHDFQSCAISNRYISEKTRLLFFSFLKRDLILGLNSLYCLVSSTWLYKPLYAYRYAKHRRKLQKWKMLADGRIKA